VLLYALPVLGILIVLARPFLTNFIGFVSAIQAVFTVYGGQLTAAARHAERGGASSSSTPAPSWFILCLLDLEGRVDLGRGPRPRRSPAYDGAGPRSLVVIAPGTSPWVGVRVNLLSGLIWHDRVVLAQQVTSGNAAKYFNAVLGRDHARPRFISYPASTPLCGSCAAAPGTPLPFRMPAYRVLPSC